MVSRDSPLADAERGTGQVTDGSLPGDGTILIGPFWPEKVRVLKATENNGSVRIEAVGVTSRQYFDQTLPLQQFLNQVKTELGGSFSFDADPHLFRLATEALRTHLAHTFDPEFAVSVSQVDPLPHQLDAVYKHLLPLPRIRFLLADDPGAGKTIMAGLLMRELMQRQDVERVLVLCPKALTDQWRREMWERFRERFTLLTGDVISGAFGQNAWIENNLVVASVDLAVQNHILPGLEQSTWDLVVFDEAHKLSAYRYGAAGKIDKTKRYQLAERLAKRTKHLLLMTATPHKGDQENFRLLLSLLDETVFATQAGLQRALDRDNSPYFLRRMKETMKDFEGKDLFLPRHVDTVAYELEPHEAELYEAVTNYVATGLELAESTRNRNVGLALTVLQRRLASSLYAVTRSLERRRERLSAELDLSRASGHVGERQHALDFDIDSDEDLEELTEEEEDALSAASNARTPAELQTEIELLNRLVEQARSARAYGPEKKLREFLRVVESQTVSSQHEKILVFTEHRDTLTYITAELRARGYRVTNIHGGMKLQDRIAAEKEFRGPTQFLVATDAAGEGINLQFCRVMINWDLPWNPNRLEQRMGRIHRYGQEFEVQIVNLVASNTREGAVLVRLMNKLEAMKAAMGHDQVYDVISGVLDGAQVRLDALMRAAILNRKSRDDILSEIDVVDSDAARAAARDALGESLATRFVDMAFINGEQRDSKERRLTPEFVERFFLDALRHEGGRLSKGHDRDWRIEFIPAEIRRAARASNTGEFGAENRLITFHKERLRKDPPAEFVAPDHPLFDVVLDRILTEGRPALAQGSVFVDKETRHPYLVWLLEAGVVNGQNLTVHKRLLALRQRDGGFEPVEPGVILDLPPAQAAPPVPERLQSAANVEAAVRFATGAYAGTYLAEVTTEQERRAQIVENALRQSVSDNLERLQERVMRQTEQSDKGKDMALALRTTNEQIDVLTKELSQRLADLNRAKVTSIETPRVVGVAAVIPPVATPIPAVVEQGEGGDKTEIELAAMRHVAEYERAHGREPVDVSKTGVGYDIKSTGNDGDVRYIEVKGHATTGDITLYYTEWSMANRMRQEFYIYEVNHALNAPELWITRDPVGKGIEPEEKVVEYRIVAEQLQVVAERAN